MAFIKLLMTGDALSEIEGSTTVDLNAVTNLILPNADAPTAPNADGEIVFDNLYTDFSTGLIRVYLSGEEQGVVTMPLAQFTTPTDNHVVTYNAANDEFELQAGGSGGGDITTDPAWAAKGELIVADANDSAQVLSVGTNDFVLTAASGETTGMKWAAAAGGAGVDATDLFLGKIWGF